MAIEITGPGSPTNPRTNGEGSEVRVGRNEPSTAQQQTGTPSTGDTVSLTDTANQLTRLESALASLPVVDTQRVEQVQRELADGSYRVDATRVASSLIAAEPGLFTNPKNSGS
jgi:negative regulator of flagellin synthesis FlgM